MFSRITVVFSAFEEVLVDSLVVTGVVESVSGDGSVPVDKVGARVPVGGGGTPSSACTCGVADSKGFAVPPGPP